MVVTGAAGGEGRAVIVRTSPETVVTAVRVVA